MGKKDNAANNEAGAVWVIAEQLNGKMRKVSLQLTGQARKLAYELNQSVACVLLGDNIEEFVKPLFSAGADYVYTGQSDYIEYYQQTSYVDAIVKLARVKKPQIILMGSTSMGRELAPLVAAKLETGLSAHCIDLIIDSNGLLEQKIPAYGGMMTIVCPEKRPQMATVAEGVFPDSDPDEQREGKQFEIAVCKPDLDHIQTIEIVQEPSKEVALEQASSVVAGGAGAGDVEGWNLIKKLAETLDAALGCTRPAVDEGWAQLETMIGQSGKMVNPDLYIGVGLSGELQHMVGIMGARLMIAINNDPKSPVFEQVDYGIIDDCKEFLPALIDIIKGGGIG